MQASLLETPPRGTLFAVAVWLSDPPMSTSARSWARWQGQVDRRCTIGVEEEVMLLQTGDHAPAERGDEVLERLAGELRLRVAPETHASVLELKTGVHATVSSAELELMGLRRQMARELRQVGLAVAAAGTHPVGKAGATKVSGAERYRLIADSMRSLSHRQATMAMHVHVGIPDPEDAVRVLNRLREALPVLLAVSANSPFSGSRDTGFCSARTLIFDGFPRTGPPRAYSSYADYVSGIDDLVASGALPDETFLWMDARLQPNLGTVELRAMDAQTKVDDVAPLVALVQSLAQRELDGPPLEHPLSTEVLAENRFLAARDGVGARLVDARRRRLVSVPALVDKLIENCRPYARALGCARELERLSRLAAVNGAVRQRTCAAERGIDAVAPMLAAHFEPRQSLAV